VGERVAPQAPETVPVIITSPRKQKTPSSKDTFSGDVIIMSNDMPAQ
jgi:hypothetical protein